MKFRIFRASCMCPAAAPMSYSPNNNATEYIDINSVEDFQKLAKLVKSTLMLRFNEKMPSIEIYDSYIE